MTDERGPKRLHDDADAPRLLRDGLAAARDVSVDPARLEALARGAAGQAAGASSGGAAAGKLLAAVGGVVGATAVVVAVLATRPGDPPARVVVAPPASSASATGVADELPAPTDGALDAPDDDEAGAPTRVARPRASLSSPPPPPPPSSSPPPQPPPAVDELAGLDEAQRALAGDPARALALCEAHARAFPRGALTEEREVLAIEALVRLGRGDAARARAEAFRAAHPASGHLRKVEGLVAR